MRILIASNNTLIRNGIQHILEQTAQAVSMFSNETVNKFSAHIQREKPDILFFDKSNHSIFTHAILMDLKKKFPAVKMVVISSLEHPQEILESLEKGIEAYMTYECDQDEIQKSISSLEKGEKFYCQKVLTRILEIQQPKSTGICKAVQLTDRETEIARYIAEGNTNKQIASVLCISPHTVHTHRKSLMKKLGVSSATEVARFAMQEGLIE